MDRSNFSTDNGTITQGCLRARPWAGAIRPRFILKIAKTELRDANICSVETDLPKARSGFDVMTESIGGFSFAYNRSAMKRARLSDGTEQAPTLKPSSKPKRN